jgi:hypothetical protein
LSDADRDGKGAVAFSKTGDPQLGEWADAIILGRYGDVPDDLAPYGSKSADDGVARACANILDSLET